jgi:hypothetical protein
VTCALTGVTDHTRAAVTLFAALDSTGEGYVVFGDGVHEVLGGGAVHVPGKRGGTFAHLADVRSSLVGSLCKRERERERENKREREREIDKASEGSTSDGTVQWSKGVKKKGARYTVSIQLMSIFICMRSTRLFVSRREAEVHTTH